MEFQPLDGSFEEEPPEQSRKDAKGKFPCDRCPYKGSTLLQLQRHKTIHGEKNMLANSASFAHIGNYQGYACVSNYLYETYIFHFVLP